MHIENIPNLIIIGNIAYDIIDFNRVDSSRKNIVDLGGACIFSSVPASLFHRVGMVGKIGNDLNISELYGYNIDLSGITKLDIPSTKFYTVWNTIDGQDRTITGEVQEKMEVGANDIPKKFLSAKHFHLTTANPTKQLEIIKFLRKYSNATISADTIDDFSNSPECKEVFDNIDIAFIDKEYTNLLDCNAEIKIIKYGKKGCLYYSKNKSFPVYSHLVENVVDKTGAGDCLNGIFLNLIVNGEKEETALRIAVDMATESIKKPGIMDLKIPERYSKKEKNEDIIK